MLLDNRTILEKADLALSDLLTAGELVPAQAQKFIRLLILESTLLPMATVRPMSSPTVKVDKIRFGSRVLRAGAEATALAAADRVKPDTSEVELNAKLFKAQTNLNDEVLEDNIEQGSLRQTIMELLGEAVSRDMEEVTVQGDTTSSDTFLAQFDGVLTSVTSNLVGPVNGALTSTTLKSMLKGMPHEFIRNKKKLRFLTSIDAETDYRDTLAARATVAGDKFLQEDTPILYNGVPMIDVPLFPENLGAGTNETNVVLTDPKNFMVGIWRKIRMETDKDIEAGVLKVVISMRFDFIYVHEPATVKATGVTVA